MEKVKITVCKTVIPTYSEPPAEELPMFAENRVHQRTSGRPYPNKVVMQVDRTDKSNKEYTVVTLENRYIKLEILPEIGGRIYSALDKTTGYHFFYKQHVIKPALIGVLGSWISGGVEFNWPFHHRASGFMPCDFKTEELQDGTAICWLSEHDPIDRMKALVGIVLKPEETCFETRIRLYNRTATEHSFLWWENAAVPVNENYQIFFPQDVTYVNFHYQKSRTTYPIAGNGVFNGIPMKTDRDISWHKNTKEATSYFASYSDYDFFGGYDHGKECGVVHIGDHHISPGKKMFTWAYNQLAASWENALTDTDGQYAELMAGSYSDNQPDFAWLAPYETKQFSQYWYPISKLGTPTFANLSCAFKIVRDKNDLFKIQSTKLLKNVRIEISCDNKIYLDTCCNLIPEECAVFPTKKLPEFVAVRITCNGKTVAEYQEQKYNQYNMPPAITDMPSAAGMNSAQELYLAGVHVDQYRDPHTNPDAYWKEALKRDINHIPTLIAMANHEYNRYNFEEASEYAVRAIENLNLYNERHKSGEAYYIYGKISEALGNTSKAYDSYYKAFWSADCAARAMTRIALIDVKNKDYINAVKHAETALDYGRNNSLCQAVLAVSYKELGNTEKSEQIIKEQLHADCLDHMMRYLSGTDTFYDILDSDPVQTCLDIAFDLAAMGRYEDIIALLTGLIDHCDRNQKKMAFYALGYYKFISGSDGSREYRNAELAELGSSYPSRPEEKYILEDVIERTGSKTAKMLLGCLLYHKRYYSEAASLWEQCDDYISKRNLAVAYFSHLDKATEALAIMNSLISTHKSDQQLLYETICLMNKLGISPEEKIALITSRNITRDDILTELAKAYNQAFMPDQALKTLLSHEFVPCEGGEHAIADQYMFAYLLKGKQSFEANDIQTALRFFREGQVLPQSLGAGIWNHCKRIPLKFFEALCLEKMDKKAEADEIFRYIADTEVEYFSNMHLKELPIYQAFSCDHLGQNLKGRHLITKYFREWQEIKKVKDNGFFGTTPFFISFIDRPEKLRLAQYLYLTGLCEAYMGNPQKAKQNLQESVRMNPDNMYAAFFVRYI